MLDSGIVKGCHLLACIFSDLGFSFGHAPLVLCLLCLFCLSCVFSLMRMTSLLLALFTKGFGPLRVHFSLLGYKKMEVSKALLIFFGLPKFFCIRFPQVVLQQICLGLSLFSVLFWVILGPQLLFLEDAPSRGYLSVSFPIQGRLGHSRATLYYLIQM